MTLLHQPPTERLTSLLDALSRGFAHVSSELVLRLLDLAQFAKDLSKHFYYVLVRRLRGCRHPDHLPFQIALLEEYRTRKTSDPSSPTPLNMCRYVRLGIIPDSRIDESGA